MTLAPEQETATTKAADWHAARLLGQRLPTHELPPELAEDLATWELKEPEQ